MAENCIFCKIINNEIPSYTIYEDEDFKAILDIQPSNPGHCVIITKAHRANLFELEDELAAKVLPLAKKIGRRLKTALGCDGMNVLQNNGAASGQTVWHYHIHLIPRWKEDSVNISWVPSAHDSEAFGKLLEKIKL